MTAVEQECYQCAAGDGSYGQSRGGSENCDEQAFHEQLLNEAAAGGADREACCEFPLAGCGSRQEQAGKVQTCEQKHGCAKAEDNQERFLKGRPQIT